MTTLQGMVAVMQAFAEGRPVECLFHGSSAWRDDQSPCWDWSSYTYRVKREPREFYLVSRPRMVGLQVFEANGRPVPGDTLSCIHVREVID